MAPEIDPPRDGGATGRAGTGVDGGAGGAGGAGLDGAVVPDPGGGAPNDQAAPGGYYVDGRTIYAADGTPHLFHGLDRPSLEWTPEGEQLSAEDYGRMASWKANVVRISLNQGFWQKGSKVYSANYASVVAQNVKWAEAAGMDVILDLHWSDRGDFGTTPAQQRMADEHSVAFWTDVATAYKGDGRVLFELYNEPHDISWDVWRNGGATPDGFTAVGMQKLYDTVRATGAQNLVLIGGIGYAFDLSGVRTHKLAGYNIVYVTHPYDTPNKQPQHWDGAFGFLTATAPVIATEFGNLRDCNTSYYTQFIAYANAHQISWTGWAWYPSGCGFPSLISDWSGTPTASGQIEKAALLAY